MPVKNLDLTPSLKDRLATYSFTLTLDQGERVSMAQIIRDIIVDYANDDFDPGLEPLEIEVKYTAPSEYEPAMARARREKVSLADVIRAGLDARLP